MRMSGKSGSGFGKAPPEKKKLSKLADDRDAAADRYDKIKAGGAPEFNVFIRLKGATDEEGMVRGGWYPVGSLTCPNSLLVGKAIFNTEEPLLQGAFRVHSKQINKEWKTKEGKSISNWQDLKNCDVEYGWNFKEYADEDINLAERPREPSEIEKVFGGFVNKIGDALNFRPSAD